MNVTGDETLEFVVGSDVQLADLLRPEDIRRLLGSALAAGASHVSVTDTKGDPLLTMGEFLTEADRLPLMLEGETIGHVVVAGAPKLIAELLREALSTMMLTNLKRMLTSEVHTNVVNLSFDELLETNRQLNASEQRYRDLAESLERTVEKRTAELKQAYARLIQQEKMVSIGQLAAGMAHEINNPLGFITSNLNTLKTYMTRSAEMLTLLRNLSTGTSSTSDIDFHWKQLKIDTILDDYEELIKESLSGLERVAGIVANLRGAAHIDDGPEAKVDLNHELEMILGMLAHETPPGTRFIKNLEPLPQLECQPTQLSQALLGIVRNALQSRDENLVITLASRVEGSQILVTIDDNGPGIPAQILPRVCEPFFTTKPVGHGRGLGLSFAYEVISALGGSLEIDSPAGTRVSIKLPLGG